jgi:hypothetical protein
MGFNRSNASMSLLRRNTETIFGGDGHIDPKRRSQILRAANKKLSQFNGQYLFVLAKDRSLKEFNINGEALGPASDIPSNGNLNKSVQDLTVSHSKGGFKYSSEFENIHQEEVQFLLVDPKEMNLYIAGLTTVIKWCLVSKKTIKRYATYCSCPLSAIKLTPDSKHLIIGSLDKS